MEAYQPLHTKLHEARIQDRRNERELETQRLDKLKLGLRLKLQASGIKPEAIQAA
jgi:hypothetical protein